MRKNYFNEEQPNEPLTEITTKDLLWNAKEDEWHTLSRLRTLWQDFVIVIDKVKGTLYIIKLNKNKESSLVDIGMYDQKINKIIPWWNRKLLS
jgi:4-aminobutyrate aminotransferase-like enzyme